MGDLHGEVPERPKGSDCKSDGFTPTEVRILPSPPYFDLARGAGIAQLVEREPSKLGVAGSNPVSRSSFRGPEAFRQAWMDAHVAQPVEHFLGKEEVTGSIPVVGFHIPGGSNRGRRFRRSKKIG